MPRMTCRAVLTAIVVLLAVSVSGCAEIRNPVSAPRISGNDRSVIISNLWAWHSSEKILALADAHCRKYGRSARFYKSQRGREIYDCVD